MLTALIILFLIIAVVAIFNIVIKQSAQRGGDEPNIAEFMVEAPNRIRIFNDSMRLIENTNNATTFIRRVDTIEEFLNWASRKVQEGMPLKMEGNVLSVRKQTYELINSNALRVALAEFAEWSEKERKPGKRFDNATIKAFEAVDGLSGCIKTASNNEEVLTEITKIRNLIEEIYSNVR